MRRDWDARAAADAERAVYTGDHAGDLPDFDESGRANYNQLVRPYLPVLLEGASARRSRAVEIGCGVGRMTAWFAREFASVHALDVSPEMIARARVRLSAFPNVTLEVNSGCDLRPLADGAFDLAFSYIVFQHVPSREVIAQYVREAARVLRPRGVFKFQVSGDQSPEYRAHARDTWLGETFSYAEAERMVADAGLSLLMAEGPGTQYFVLTARKAPPEPERGPRPYIFAGEPWAATQLVKGWQAAVDRSWRPMEAASEVLLGVPAARPARFFLGLYCWDAGRRRVVSPFGAVELEGAGDHFIDLPAEPLARVAMRIEPPCARPPAVRALGYYVPA